MICPRLLRWSLRGNVQNQLATLSNYKIYYFYAGIVGICISRSSPICLGNSIKTGLHFSLSGYLPHEFYFLSLIILIIFFTSFFDMYGSIGIDNIFLDNFSDTGKLFFLSPRLEKTFSRCIGFL